MVKQLNQTKKIKVFTVCAGVGTGEFALKQLGVDFETVGFSEINKKAIQCFQQNHGGKNFGDITKVKPQDIPDHNLFTAGFPCQAFSIAGKRMGTDDIRGQVIYYILEILKVKRPEHVLLENVRGLLSWNKGELFNFIIRELKKMYSTVQYKILNSKDYGVPQNRERIFIYATNKDVPFGWNFIPKKQELKLKLKDILEDNPNSKYNIEKSELIRRKKQAESKVDSKYTITPHQIEYYTKHAKKRGTTFGKNINSNTAMCLTARNPKRSLIEANLVTVDNKYHLTDKQIEYALNYKKKKGGKINIDKSVCGCLKSDNPKRHIHESHLVTVDNKYHLTDKQIEQLNKKSEQRGRDLNLNINRDIAHTLFAGRPVGHVESNLITVNPIGEVMPNCPEIGEAKRIYSDKGISPCIKKSNIIVHSKHPRTGNPKTGGTGPLKKEDGTTYCLDTQNSQFIEFKNNVRVLTPLECFRLQGFLHDEVNLKDLSDTAKYELAGNGWTLTVIVEIFRKILSL